MNLGTGKSRTVYAFVACVLVCGMLALWQAAATSNANVNFFFSSPAGAFWALMGNVQSGQAYIDILASAKETIGALAVGVLWGASLGMLGLWLPDARSILAGAISVLAALPILALAPMFLIWFGVDIGLKVALGGLLSGLVVATQVLGAHRVVTPELGEFIAANRIRISTSVRKIVLPLAVPAALQRFPDAVNGAFLGVFVGEFIAADRGVGYRILRSGSLYAVDQVLASTTLALLLLLGLQLAMAFMSAAIISAVQQASLAECIRLPRSR
jgi:NitT/TauT family transport system permease protein